jgi:DNA segregation ATPase FtsK/SpoIIIE, S-DNA-T family
VQGFEHRTSLPAADDWYERLRTVELGTSEHGQAACVALLGSHILIAGQTGAGKGSVIWSTLLRLLPAIEAGVVRPWGWDLKGGMELGMGRSFFGDRYADDPESAAALLERYENELSARTKALAGKVRKFTPSTDTPLELGVFDELGFLVGLLPDRKQREHVERLLSGVLVRGRACGYTCLGALQDPRKSILDARDLWPTRVAMRLPKPMVDLVLGTGAYEAGATCDLIPPGEAGAGYAFMVDEASILPVLLRAHWCSDDAIRQAAAKLSVPSAPRLSVVK